MNVGMFSFLGIVKASGFHQGILKLAMEPSLLGNALKGSGPDRKVKLDRNPGIDEVISFDVLCRNGYTNFALSYGMYTFFIGGNGR